jgi:nitrite reductase/ring-hydroxylating ferredoxin subunit
MVRSYPEGWFRVAAEDDLPRGGVLAVQAFGRELVLFRGEDGRAAALDAHCPHAGAHLGHGGRVEGCVLRCPFHGLRYGLDGLCVEDRRERAALRAWPLESWQGQLVVFYSAEPREPDWRLPVVVDEGWTRPRWRTLRLAGHVQDVAENGVDFAHFVTVHRYSNLREPSVEIDGNKLHSRFGFDRRNPLWERLGEVSAIFDTDMWGLGCSITDLRALSMHFRLLLLATQIDTREFDFSIGISLERPFAARGFARVIFDAAAANVLRFMHATIVGDVLQDREIWAHRKHLARPALSASDAGLVQFRKYAERFYRP